MLLVVVLSLASVQGKIANSYVIGTGVQANPNPCFICDQSSGQWGAWGEWSACSSAYGTPVQMRTRSCPTNNCQGGSSQESKPCVLYDPQPTQPEWGAWGSWSPCSATCGSGTTTRTRVCNNYCTTCQCIGQAQESKPCNSQPCCSWSAWSSWSACSVTCGTGGAITRTRQCSCGSGCPGSSNEQEPCPQQPACPCTTCQQPPEPCNTCNQPVVIVTPAPCTTCYQPVPTCSTCGPAQPFYDPYENGRKKRAIEGAKNATLTN
ncbi:unnamed protein product [Caenorhabditis bovis]|uniref:Thrombospondin type 1 domain protein n=1 Tax=Caenorhabditis bovis TaxID=2654633 RepID=A0A8S1EG82_9PELO|nr:unnamed protein product [Caenorhabditis bovis]